MAHATSGQVTALGIEALRLNPSQLRHDMMQGLVGLPKPELHRLLELALNSGLTMTVKGPATLSVERKRIFNHRHWFNCELSDWRGPLTASYQDTRGVEQVDPLIAVGEINFSKVCFSKCLLDVEMTITLSERKKRLESDGLVPLDIRDCLALFTEKGHLTLEWLHHVRLVTCMDFPGRVLHQPDTNQAVIPYLAYVEGKGWTIGLRSFRDSLIGADALCPSAAVHLESLSA